MVVLLTGEAHAQGNANQAAAEVLFSEGRRLMAEGQYTAACAKFAESDRLDASVSTLLNLGACYEKAGRTASAWATFRRAMSAAHAAGRADYMAIAQRRASELEPTLSRVITTLGGVQAPPGLEIKRDGTLVGEAERDVPIPIDPGQHTFDVTAKGKKPWTTKVWIDARTPLTTLTIPSLEDQPPDPVAPPPLSSEASSGSARGRSQRIVGLVAGGVGVAGAVAGTVLLLNAKSNYNDSLQNCPRAKDLCNADGVAQRDRALSYGTAATVAFGVGAAALVAGSVLWWTAPSSDGRAPPLAIAATPGGALVRGEW